MSTARVTISLPDETLKRVDALASRDGRSVSNMLHVLVERALVLVARERPVQVAPTR